MHGTFEPWTDAQLAAVTTLSKAGLTIKKIAETIGRTYHSVHHRRLREAKGIAYVYRARWSVEDNAKLTQMWLAGKTQTQIAKEMGVTPGAVAGRLSRLNLRTSERPKREPKPRAPRVPKPWSERKKYYNKPVIEMLPEPEALRLPLSELALNGCRYIVTDDSPFLYCGHEQAGGSSYCAHHHHVVWQPASARVRNARPR